MTKKQKKVLARIIIAAVLVIALQFVPVEGYVRFGLYMIPYLVIGYDILKMATMGSARLLGRDKEIGSLEKGKCADLFLVRADRLELVGAMFDPKSVLGTVGLKGAVDYTIVNGEVAVENGHLARIDEEKLSREAGEQVMGAYQAGELGIYSAYSLIKHFRRVQQGKK